MRRFPNLYQINTQTFLSSLAEKYGRRVTLSSIPDDELMPLAGLGIDYIWMMGVWQRSPAARRLAILSPGLRREYDRLVPGWSAEDISGSPYAVYGYHLDPAFGEENELVDFKARINRLGMGLVLDFVPNHLALDHPWTVNNPVRFVSGRPADVQKHPDWFFPVDGNYLAHGRDPYFAPWNDTVQLNFFSGDLRQALFSELERIAGLADGLRCDMAMLALNEVFRQVWGEVLHSSSPPPPEFWDEAIGRVKQHQPDFMFMAEVYWGLDRRLQELGFDFTYDKPLYDHLLHGNGAHVAGYLRSEGHRLDRQVHFIENHDEARAVTAFGRERSLVAAIVTATIPGLRFYQHGQFEGHKIKVPVQLGRAPVENSDAEIVHFYRQLLSAASSTVFHDGNWEVLEVESAWAGNDSYGNILAWQWRYRDRWVVIAVNYSSVQSQAWIKLNLKNEPAGNITFEDVISGLKYVRNLAELAGKGLYVDLQPYRVHFLDAGNG